MPSLQLGNTTAQRSWL